MLGVIVGLVLLGLAFFLDTRFPHSTGYMAVGSLVFYVAFFAIGMGSLPIPFPS